MRLGMRLGRSSRSVRARALLLSLLGLSVVALTTSRALADAQSTRTTTPPRIYNKGRNFRIPFNLNAEGRDRVKEVHLLVSEDQGYTWRPISKTFPDHPTFTFRAAHDGEYWFAVQTVTVDGKQSPRPDATIEPNLKVVVDTLPPSLILEPEERRGSTVAVRWEVKDENLDLKTLVLEYQVEGVGTWRRVPIRRPKLIGAYSWDAGTAEALKVRASVADKAGNLSEAFLDIAEGTAAPPTLASDEDTVALGRSQVERISNAPRSDIVAGPDFPPVGLEPSVNPGTNSGRRVGPRAQQNDRQGRGTQAPPAARERESGANAPRPSSAATSEAPAVDLFAAAGASGAGIGPATSPAGPSASPSPSGISPPISGRERGGTLLVASPRFKLQYAVDDAGPNGPAMVELWITQDGGRTWIRRGEDPDRLSPIDVDLGGEGTYGLYLVARSATGMGDQPPAPGDPPQTWVEVDSTPPLVQLYPPQVGTGVNSGKVAIAWRSSDLHLAPKSVSIFWRPDQSGTDWQLLADGQENVGTFIWSVPTAVPPRFHLRVEAVDTVGHRGGQDTTEMGAIMVDRSRPRSRIIGLDPNARAGMGPDARSMR